MQFCMPWLFPNLNVLTKYAVNNIAYQSEHFKIPWSFAAFTINSYATLNVHIYSTFWCHNVIVFFHHETPMVTLFNLHCNWYVSFIVKLAFIILCWWNIILNIFYGNLSIRLFMCEIAFYLDQIQWLLIQMVELCDTVMGEYIQSCLIHFIPKSIEVEYPIA